MATGEIEVAAAELKVLNEAAVPPFQISDEAALASDDLRLRYRYLDLRRPRLQANLGLRHKVTMAVRRYFDEQGFWEVETPVLGKSTPEGARDYLVPSRVHPGEFYALPQSPQLFKQLLMIAGTDRYFQIVKCFRDEDLRADRQPEFTQVDVEMSFARPELVFGLIEPLMQQRLPRHRPGRFRCRSAGCRTPRRSPATGRTSPTCASAWRSRTCPAVFAETAVHAVPRRARQAAGSVRGFVVPGGAKYSRKQLDGLTEQARQAGASGLVWVRLAEDGVKSPALKGAGEATLRAALERAGADGAGPAAAGGGRARRDVQGARPACACRSARDEGLAKPDEFAFTWVTDFPMFEWDEEEKRFAAMHHPFTSPVPEDLDALETEPGRVRAQAYDLVLNGSEIGGGSIRIHDADVQARVFRAINLTDEEARQRFGFFLQALTFGTPPHGGIALGLDRTVAILAGESSIREVIAFPKTAAAVDQMTGAPDDGGRPAAAGAAAERSEARRRRSAGSRRPRGLRARPPCGTIRRLSISHGRRYAPPERSSMRKIAVPEEGIETLFGSYDENLRFLESLLNVSIRTQGQDLLVEGDPASAEKVERLVAGPGLARRARATGSRTAT